MEYLPYPSHLGVPHVVVPYLPDFEYDHLDFARFPKRSGFSGDPALDVHRPCRERAAFVQSWLYFGLIEVFCSQSFDKASFISQGSASPQIVNGAALQDLLLLTKSRVTKGRLKRNRNKHPSYLTMRASLKVAKRASFAVDAVQDDDQTLSAVLLSVKILIIYLAEFYNTLFYAGDDHEEHHRSESRRIPSQAISRAPILEHGQESTLSSPARLLKDRMRQSGWCVHQILQMFQTQNYCIIYYLSSIRREEPEGVNHEACSATRCCAYNTNDDTYRVRHVQDACRCHLLRIPIERVNNIVKGGGIPLIEMGDFGDAQSEVKVIECTANSRYTAISHVWVDGLGNPSSNALPRCQLQRLARQLEALPEQSWSTYLMKRFQRGSVAPPLMWMDTLCIPIPTQQERSNQRGRTTVRGKAIDMMALIYTGAEQVLVIDGENSKVDHQTEPRELTDARILFSKWNARCWTLQEGALARHCLFQFQDSATFASTRAESSVQRVRRKLKSVPKSPSILRKIQIVRQVFNELIISLFSILWILVSNGPDTSRSMSQRFIAQALSKATSRRFNEHYLGQALSEKAFCAAQTDLSEVSRVGVTMRRRSSSFRLMHRFVRTWNNMCRRSTKKSEDRHIILATLNDFSAAQIMSLNTPVERTKMMLDYIGRVPLDILWRDCLRPQGGIDHADRWIPSIPGPEPLLESITLRFTTKGLVLEADQDGRLPMIFLVDSGSIPSRFCFKHNQGARDSWFWINCTQHGNDNLPRRKSDRVCLILCSQTLKGARLMVKEQEFMGVNTIYTRYDCPLTFTIESHEPFNNNFAAVPVLLAEKFPVGRKLIIEHRVDKESREKLLRRSWDLYNGKTSILVITAVFTGALSGMYMFVEFDLACKLSGPVGAFVWWLVVAANLVVVWVCLAIYLRWRYVRTWTAWQASFRHDWAPEPPMWKRFLRMICRRRVWLPVEEAALQLS